MGRIKNYDWYWFIQPHSFLPPCRIYLNHHQPQGILRLPSEGFPKSRSHPFLEPTQQRWSLHHHQLDFEELHELNEVCWRFLLYRNQPWLGCPSWHHRNPRQQQYRDHLVLPQMGLRIDRLRQLHLPRHMERYWIKLCQNCREIIPQSVHHILIKLKCRCPFDQRYRSWRFQPALKYCWCLRW